MTGMALGILRQRADPLKLGRSSSLTPIPKASMTLLSLTATDLRREYPAVLTHLARFSHRNLGDAPTFAIRAPTSTSVEVRIQGEHDGWPQSYSHVEHHLLLDLEGGYVEHVPTGTLWGGIEHLLWVAIDGVLGDVPAFRLPAFESMTRRLR